MAQECGRFQPEDSVRRCRHTRSVPLTDLFLFSNEEEPRIGQLGKVSCV
ncbi:mCG4750, isoform CRA_d [Mus musculus]|nr:mCG4750, isoform CRA_d [Mus musculus]